MNQKYIGVMVFIGGMSVMASEMAASRLLAPYFGTSLFVWTNLIGIVMIALTIGYKYGGKLADKNPKTEILGLIMLIGGLYVTLLPTLTKPIMKLSTKAINTGSSGDFFGSLIASVLLIALPMILLGMVSPMAIRIKSKQVSKVGATAGNVYALGTAGSIIGTFLPALVTIPFLGTRKTFVLFGLILMLVGIPALKKKWLGFAAIIALPLWLINPAIKADSHMIEERESLYNYIQIIEYGNTKTLRLNEGYAVHSIYNPNTAITGGVWDYFSIIPLELEAPKNALIIGLAGGSISRAYNEFYPEIEITGVEIDPEIVTSAYKHFGLKEQNVKVIVRDGRTYLDNTDETYSIIIVDAYKQPYIPFHLTTKEFFSGVKTHLTKDGIAAINVGVTSDESVVLETVTNTMASVFENVYIVSVPETFNYVVLASDKELFTKDKVVAPDRIISKLWKYAKTTHNIKEYDDNTAIFTDDRAPVEMMTDLMILNYALD